MPCPSLGEQFDRIESILNRLPLGYAYEINFGTDGTQPPEMTVKIQGHYDSFIHDYRMYTRSARTDYHEEKDFENLVAWTRHTVFAILEEQKPSQEITSNGEDEDGNIPF